MYEKKNAPWLNRWIKSYDEHNRYRDQREQVAAFPQVLRESSLWQCHYVACPTSNIINLVRIVKNLKGPDLVC